MSEQIEEVVEPVDEEVVEEIEEPSAEGDSPDVPVSVEDVAREMGWKPKEEWRGDKSGWKPAKDWILGSKRIMDDRARKIDSLEEKFNSFNSLMMKTVNEASNRAREEERARWLKAREEAFEEQDKAKFEKADRELRKIEAAPPVDDEWTTHEAEFRKANAWYGDDKRMTAFVNRRAREMSQDMPGLSAPEFYDLIAQEAKDKFPDKFTPIKMGGEGDSRPNTRTGKSARDLPPEAKQAGQMFVEEGLFKSLEDYAKEYFANV